MSLRTKRAEIADEITALEKQIHEREIAIIILDGHILGLEEACILGPLEAPRRHRRDLRALITVERQNGLAPAEIARKLRIRLSQVVRCLPQEGQAE
jgi:hypothetical protein